MTLAEDIAGKRVLVLGLGMSGLSAARFCADRGASVVAADERAADALAGLDQLPGTVKCVTGQPFPNAAGFDLVIPSPGIPPERYREGAARIWGDIELAWRGLPIPLVAVTGTNGKSTTVRLIEAMLGAAGYRARAAGNVGSPALSLLGEPLDFAVLEVSSFQLESVEGFRPKVAVVLNLSPDHLDRHGNLDTYAEAKRQLIAQQGEDDFAILNFDDDVVRAFANGSQASVVPFRMSGPVLDPKYTRAAWFDSGAVVLREHETMQRVALDSLALEGRHNRENTLAALAAVWCLGADPIRAIDALIEFRGLPHRSEGVAAAGDVHYVNDSKATNPGAALRSIEGFRRPILWIAGGRGKGLDFAELASAAGKAVRVALLIGEATDALEAALAGHVRSERCEDLPAAVRRAHALAESGDVVLLAPACASFDQFSNFEERGDCFRRAVLDVTGGAQA